MFINPLYLLLLLPAALGWYAQVRVQTAYRRYSREPNKYGLTGTEIAERLAAYLGLKGLSLELIPGYLTDHYDTRANTLYLTEGIAASRSVTAMGIVAHEVLHAAQDLEGYPLMRIRSWLGGILARIPNFAVWGILLGLAFQLPALVVLSAMVMLASVVLGLTALPVERNSSARALVALQESGLADADDLEGAEAVLRSAALTYVAGLVQYVSRLAFFGLLIAMALGLRGR